MQNRNCLSRLQQATSQQFEATPLRGKNVECPGRKKDWIVRWTSNAMTMEQLVANTQLTVSTVFSTSCGKSFGPTESPGHKLYKRPIQTDKLHECELPGIEDDLKGMQSPLLIELFCMWYYLRCSSQCGVPYDGCRPRAQQDNTKSRPFIWILPDATAGLQWNMLCWTSMW